jgi:hypothetical protein
MNTNANQRSTENGARTNVERGAGLMERYNSLRWTAPADCREPSVRITPPGHDDAAKDALMRCYNG